MASTLMIGEKKMPDSHEKLDRYEQALALAKEQDFDPREVVELLKTAMTDGDDRAAYALGTWYLHGTHVRKNEKKAFAMIKVAAGGGNPSALYDLAVFYEKGVVVEVDETAALSFYMDAAIRGDSQSHYEVGRMFWYGLGTTESRVIAEVWLKRAEELGISEDSISKLN